MFYKFNNFTGRIGESTQLKAYRPHGFQPEMPLPKITPRVETEPVRKMASISLTTPKAETGQNLGKIPQSAGYQYLLRMQKHFQKTDAEFVWRATPRAKVFSYGGMGMTAALLVMSMYALGAFAYSK